MLISVYMCVLHKFMCSTASRNPWMPEQNSIECPGTGVTDGYELPCGVLGTEPRSSARVTSVLNC